MAIDHSLTYRQFSFRNLGHRQRLRAIGKLVDSVSLPEGTRYADVGCSNGYVTNFVRRRLALSIADAFDYEQGHFEVGRAQYPELRFAELNITKSPLHDTYGFITCFETLEHVGDVRAAVENLVASTARGGTILISVPVEHGFKGLLKYAVKRWVYRYSLAELPGGESVAGAYLTALARGSRIDGFREAGRQGWGTHFGFDTRQVSDALSSLRVSFRSSSSSFTRFFLVRVS